MSVSKIGSENNAYQNYVNNTQIMQETMERVKSETVKQEQNEDGEAAFSKLAEEKSATVEISKDGLQSYKESLVKSGVEGLSQNDGTKGIIMTDFHTLMGSRMPSIYGEKDENGEYIRNYFSKEETIEHMKQAYAGLHDEIINGYAAGMRETYVEDKTTENGYRKLTMDEELAELNKAYKEYADRYASHNDQSILDILSAYEKRASELSNDRVQVTI